MPSELAIKTAQDRATTTGFLDRLDREGRIERIPDKKDRRSLRIYLTAKPGSRREAILTLFEKTNQTFLERFSAEEWKQMQAILNRLDDPA